MKKTIKLTEKDLSRIVNRVINEQLSDEHWADFGFKDEESFIEDYKNSDDYAESLFWEMTEELEENVNEFIQGLGINRIISKYQNKFREKYPNYYNNRSFGNYNIDDLLDIKTDDLNYTDLSSNIVDEIIESIRRK
jgi:hypothetical protein